MFGGMTQQRQRNAERANGCIQLREDHALVGTVKGGMKTLVKQKLGLPEPVAEIATNVGMKAALGRVNSGLAKVQKNASLIRVPGMNGL